MKSFELTIGGVPVFVNRGLPYLQGFIENYARQASVHILCDTNTVNHCLPLLPFLQSLNDTPIVIPDGEQHKTLASCEAIWRALVLQHANRDSLLVNLGGGMITDIGGFCAATYMRGMRFIHVPTTLLAMCDAALGGKHGVDFEGLKNYIGIFSEPEQVCIDTGFLQTLPQRQLRNGMAEVVKAAVIGDAELFHSLEQTVMSDASLTGILYHAIRVKKRFVDEDFDDTGIRAALNFGHTAGHAIESFFLQTDSPLLHGESIALGMSIETWLSHLHLGSPDRETCRRITRLIQEMTPVTVPGPVKLRDLRYSLTRDKKQKNKAVQYTLLRGIGQVAVGQEVGLETLEMLLADEEISTLFPWLSGSI